MNDRTEERLQPAALQVSFPQSQESDQSHSVSVTFWDVTLEDSVLSQKIRCEFPTSNLTVDQVIEKAREQYRRDIWKLAE